jgi:O-antigen/teichoic acid export membrane protein
LNQIILGRFLFVEDYGRLNLALSVMEIIISIIVFGLYGGLSSFIPFHLAREEKSIVIGSIRFSLILVLLTSMMIGTILFLSSESLAINIFMIELLFYFSIFLYWTSIIYNT